MKHKLRQLLALILALSMSLSLLSANVWAAETSEGEVEILRSESVDEQEDEPEEEPEEEPESKQKEDTEGEESQEEEETQSEEEEAEAEEETAEEPAEAEPEPEEKGESSQETVEQPQTKNKAKKLGKSRMLTAQTQTEELLTTITGTGSNARTATSANVSYSTEGVATLTFSGSVSYQASPAWGWWGYGWTATVNAAEGYTITKCVFYDDANRTATDSSSPFVVETTEEDKTPRINGTPIDGGKSQSKGLKKIEVYGYATPAATHSVNITAGDHMTKTAGSGDAEQTGLTGAMTDVVYTADNGYYYPTDYSVAEVSGIKVARNSYTQITVSGTPTADAAITLTAPTAKTTPDAPTTAAAVNCTTASNNDGKLTGVTTAMEYKKSDAENWTAGTGSDITDLVPGTYYVRVKATETTNASTNQELTIKGFISYTVTFKVVNGKWNEGEGDAATADKTVTLTGHDGDTLKLTADQIPAVGTKPGDTYKAGSWDVTPNTTTAITEATTYTYTYAEKDAQTISADNVTATYGDTGKSVSARVTEPNTGGGTISYAVKIGSEDYIDVNASTGALNIKKAGTATVVVTAAETDNHKAATKEVTVTINKATPILSNISAEDITYGQALSASTVSGTATGLNNAEVTGTWAWSTSTTKPAVSDSGKTEYDVTFTSSDSNYYATGTVKLTVNPKVLTLNWGTNSFTYDGQAHAPTASTTNLETADAGKVTVTVDGAQTNASDTAYTATASALTGDRASNYKLPTENTKTFTIAQKEVELSWGNTTLTYNGKSQKPTATVTNLETADTDKVSVTVTGEQTNASDTAYTATASALTGDRASNYKLPTENTNTFTIGKATITVTAKDKTITYGEAPANDGVTYTGFVNNETASVISGTPTYTYSYRQYDNAGSDYIITPVVTGLSAANYSFSAANGKLTVNQKPITFNWPSEANSTFVYDGTEKSVTATAVTVNNDSLTLAYENNSKTDKGDYTAKVTGISGDKAANYVLNTNEATASHSWKITQAENAINTLTLNGWTYGDTANTPSATATFGTPTFTYSDQENGTYTATVPTAAGTHYVKATVAETNDYNGATKVQSFTIAQKEVGLNWANTSFTYDGNEHAPTASATNLEAADADKVSVTVIGEQKNASATAYTATASALTGDRASNYKLPSNATQSFTIDPKAITATADDKSTSYKNNLAALTFTLSDGALAQGDSEASLKITASTEATKDSPKGTYPITLAKGQDSNPNYDVTLKNGTYTINEADATITASTYNGTYDGQEHSITVTVKDEVHNIVDLVKQLFGLNNTPEATVYYSTVSIDDALNQKNTTAPTRKDVGETTVYYAVEFGGNYKAEPPVTGSQTVAITRKDLTITANNQNVAYNGSFATGTDLVTCDTLVGNDELTEITLTLTNDNTIVPSDAKIMQNGEDKTQNYNISYANGTFSKSAAPAPAPAPTPTTETITIPVSGEGKDAKTTAVTVEVKNNTATVTSADIGDVLDAKDVGTVTVNVDSLPNTVDEVVLPTELVEKVAKAVADKDNDASGLEIKLPTGTVTFDAKTVAAIADKANGKDVTLHLDTVSESSLTSGQQSTVKELNALVVLDAYVTADGKRISDFDGGKATFSVPVKLKEGQDAKGVVAYFVAANGEKTEIPCTYDGENAVGTVTHFSNYVVAYDVAKAQKAEEDAKAVEDAVKDLNALPTAADVKLEDKEAIEKARAAYDALTDEQKAKVPADTLKKLTDAEAALKAAEPEPTPEPGKVSYDDLTEAEKKQADEIASALGVNKDTAAAMVKAAAELGVSLDTVKLSGSALAKMDVDSSDPKGTDFGKLTARATKRTNSALTLQWTKQKKADGYLIYGNKCGKGNKMKLLKTIKKNGTVSFTQKKLKKGTYYKYMVVAYKNVNGKKMPIAASVVLHAPTKGGKVTVAKSVKVTNTKKKAITKATVKKGKTFQLKASEVKDEKKLKVKTHRKIKFESSNKAIATVNAKGKITGKKKGKATVWAYAQNGIFKAIQVTVK